MSEQVYIKNLPQRLSQIVNDLAKKSARTVAVELQGMPRKFLVAAWAFYPRVLRVRTGRLRESFEMVSRRVSDSEWAVGLKSAVEYAAIQHEGGRTRAHVIEPRNKKALFWPGARHPVRRVNHPGSQIKPKYYFSEPMKEQTDLMIERLKKEITF